MSQVQMEWVLGGVVTLIFAILGILFSMSMQNKAKLNRHEVVLARFDGVMDKMENLEEAFRSALDRHELKEDRQFQSIQHKLEKLTVSVALLNKSGVGLTE